MGVNMISKRRLSKGMKTERVGQTVHRRGPETGRRWCKIFSAILKSLEPYGELLREFTQGKDATITISENNTTDITKNSNWLGDGLIH